MRRRVLVGVSLIGLLPILIAVTARNAEAQDEENRLEQVEQRIQEVRARMETAERLREAYEEDMDATQVRISVLKSTLSEAEVALIRAEGEVLVVEDAVTSLGRRIRLLDAELAATRLDQRLTQDLIREKAVELYMSASSGIETVLLGSEDLKSTAVKLAYNQDLLADTELLLKSIELLERQELVRQDRLREEQERESALLEDLEAEVARAEEYRASAATALQNLEDELVLQISLLDEIIAEIDRHERDEASLERESRQLELEILRRQVREGRRPGKLAWPVGGPVTSPFGQRVHPILGGLRMHNGIDLGSTYGQSIHAAGNGLVIFAEPWGGYGRTVVIDHGGGLSSLYAHQSSIAVSVGREVQAGDVIGYIGCTGYCTGPHLHFEVREVGVPVDPMHYLTG